VSHPSENSKAKPKAFASLTAGKKIQNQKPEDLDRWADGNTVCRVIRRNRAADRARLPRKNVIARQRHNVTAGKASASRGSLRLTPFNRCLFGGILDFAETARPVIQLSDRNENILARCAF
jgi:hypothetical protein